MAHTYPRGIFGGTGGVVGAMLAGAHWPVAVLAGIAVGVLGIGIDRFLARRAAHHRH